MLEILEKRIQELTAILEHNAGQYNAMVGRLAEAKELYEAAKKASLGEVLDGVVTGLEKIKADEDREQSSAPS